MRRVFSMEHAPLSPFSIVKKRIARGLYWLVGQAVPVAYARGGLISVHSHAFMTDPAFIKAYARGLRAIGGVDTYQWQWRIHIGLWIARMASRLEGAFF